MTILEELKHTKSHVVSTGAKFRYEINALRAFAVLAVLAYHFHIPLITGGFSGVDVFFVISGFLVSSQILDSYSRGDFSYLKFYNSRLRRIFPALLVVCIVSLVWGWFFYLPLNYINKTRHAVSALFFVSNYAFDGERGYFDAASNTKALLHTWSLSVEGQFYLFLPAFLILSLRFAKRNFSLLMCAVFVGLLAWAIYVSWTLPGKGFYLLSCRAWEFLAGVILANIRHLKPNTSIANVISVTSIIVLLASFAYIDSSMAWPGLWTLIPVLAAAAMISIGDAPLTRPFLASIPMQWFGDISYSLYLWHWPVMVFWNNVASMYGRSLSAIDVMGMIFLSVFLAALSWRYVEQPIRQNRKWWTARRITAGALVGAVSFIFFGAVVLATHGIPTRLPAYVQRAQDAIFVNTPRDECFRNGDSKKEVPEQFCTFGSSTAMSPSLVLWGDSHANQYATALSDAASALGLSGIIATQSGCAAKNISAGKFTSPGCESFSAEVYNYIKDHPSIHTVILGKWWGDKYNEESISLSINLARDLTAQGKSVILIGSLPIPGFDVPERWSNKQIQLMQPIDFMVTPLATQTVALSTRSRLVTELSPLIRDKKLVYIDPLKRLCDNTDCSLVENGRSNFRDDSHISQSASLSFIQDFAEALSKVEDK